MPRWTTKTMLRELREFKKDENLQGSESIDDVIGTLQDRFIEEEMNKSLARPKPKNVKTEKGTDA